MYVCFKSFDDDVVYDLVHLCLNTFFLCVCVCVVCQVVVKVLAQGGSPLMYLRDPWNRFDCLIVINGWIEVREFTILFKTLRQNKHARFMARANTY